MVLQYWAHFATWSVAVDGLSGKISEQCSGPSEKSRARFAALLNLGLSGFDLVVATMPWSSESRKGGATSGTLHRQRGGSEEEKVESSEVAAGLPLASKEFGFWDLGLQGIGG